MTWTTRLTETTNSPRASSYPGRHQSEWPADMASESVADFAGIRTAWLRLENLPTAQAGGGLKTGDQLSDGIVKVTGAELPQCGDTRKAVTLIPRGEERDQGVAGKLRPAELAASAWSRRAGVSRRAVTKGGILHA